jgi:hypothetical protein
MPPITRPDGLGMKAPDQLGNDRFNAPALLNQGVWPVLEVRLASLTRGEQVYSLVAPLLSPPRAPVAAVTQHPVGFQN